MAENIIIIDGQELSFENGETILQVAERNGIFIPTLCYLKTGATPTGACRVCLVEIENARSLMAACTVPAAPNMVVTTNSPPVVRARRMNLELLLASGQHNCLAQDQDADSWTDFQLKALKDKEHKELCPAYGICRLQDLAVKYRVRTTHFTPSETPFPLENVNPFIVRDFSRCVLCGRCVQACNEVQVNNAISYGYRGSSSKIVAAGDRSLSESDCVFCGECVQVCPVGALVPVKDFASEISSVGAVKIRTTCSYCSVGCQVYLHVKDNKVIKVTGVEGVAPNNGSLCVKGRFGYDYINDPNRLKTPMILENGKHREASWDEALKLVADNLKKVKGDSIGVVTSTRITTEDSYIAQKFARDVIGTNNIDHQLSQSSKVAGLADGTGSGAMTNPIEDIEKSDVILVAGSNITESHGVLSSYIKRAVTLKGAKLIVIDPRKITITRFANVWMRQNPGTDVAWINGLINVIINEKLTDESYISSRTSGLADLQSSVEKFTPEYVEGITGIPKDQIVEAARIYAEGNASSIILGMGMTQQAGGSECVKALTNLAMICGNIGIEGGGVNPLRGQNNAQGACDMGCMPDMLPGNKKIDDSSSGLSFSAMMGKAREGGIKAMYIIGDNPAGTGSAQIKESLEKLDFLVVQDIFMTETAKMANVVLPSASFAEKDGTFVNTERRVQRVRKAIDSPGDAKEDWRIICDLSKAVGQALDYDSPQAIMQEIAEIVSSYAGVNYDRLDSNGVICPSTADGSGTPRLHVDKFICGQGVLQVVEFTPPENAPDAQLPLYLITGRNLYQFRAATSGIPALPGCPSEPFAEISLEDAVACKVGDDDTIKISSKAGEVQLKVVISEKAMTGIVFVPQPFAAPLDPAAETLEHKVCAVKIEKA